MKWDATQCNAMRCNAMYVGHMQTMAGLAVELGRQTWANCTSAPSQKRGSQHLMQPRHSPTNLDARCSHTKQLIISIPKRIHPCVPCRRFHVMATMRFFLGSPYLNILKPSGDLSAGSWSFVALVLAICVLGNIPDATWWYFSPNDGWIYQLIQLLYPLGRPSLIGLIAFFSVESLMCLPGVASYCRTYGRPL